MSVHRLRSLVRLAATLAAAATVAACATVPSVPERPEDYLPSGYPAYFAADIAGGREVVLSVLTALDVDLAGVVERTDRIAGAVDYFPGEPVRMVAVAVGRFPRGGVSTTFALDRSFRRVVRTVEGSRLVYYEERNGAVQLSVPASGRLYLATGSIEELLLGADRSGPADDGGSSHSGGIDPALYAELTQVGAAGGPILAFVLHDPGAGLLGRLGVPAQGLPLGQIVLSVRPTADALALDGRVDLRSERDAVLFGRLGRLFVTLFVRALGLDMAGARQESTVAVEGPAVVFRNIPMTLDELAEVVRRIAGDGTDPR